MFKRLLLVTTVCVGLLVPLSLYQYCCFLYYPFDKRSFNSSSWIAGSLNIRSSMSLDAVRFVPVGTSIELVDELLGKPYLEHKDHVWPKRPKGTIRSYTYRLGCWSWVGYDAAFFVVHFDQHDRVIKAEINGY